MKKFILIAFIFLSVATGAWAADLRPDNPKPDDINIAFTIDNNYPDFVLVVIHSIFMNNHSNSHYNFYIIENNITQHNKNKMRKIVEKQGQSIKFINIDTKIIDDGNYFFTFSTNKRITPIGMARIMISSLLPEKVERVIYLDGDILVLDDLKPLFTADLGKFSTGMIENCSKEKYLIFDFGDKYYNSGVILMDLKKWRAQKIEEQLLKYLKSDYDKFIYAPKTESKNFQYPDQDLINVVLNNKIKTLPPKWNNQRYADSNPLDKKSAAIVHFIGPKKPWCLTMPYGGGYKAYYHYWDSSEVRYSRFYYGCVAKFEKYKKYCSYKIKRYKKWLRTHFNDVKVKEIAP